ncbi:MAG: glycosyltransferase [Oscillospiraceae bacterium]|nr:glycosyltransferase [Oscillospiraceae bacterium]
MNVLYLIHHAGQGGTERYVRDLMESGRVTPVFAYTQDGLLRKRAEALGIPVFRVPMPRRYGLRAARAVAGLCRDRQIDVIHTQFLRENTIALLSRLFYRKPRVVYTNHLFFPNGFVTRLSNRVLSRLQHAVIAVCGPARVQLIRNGIPARLIRLIHNGVDPAAWARLPNGAVRQETGVPDGVPVILYAARFVEGKGHACLLEALAGLKELPFHLLLAGDGELRAETEKLAGRLGLSDRTSFLGFREDMRAVLSAAAICVNAASTEACSYNILEAMAMGVPQVVSDGGGNADLIGGENGLTYRDGDPEALADALRRLLTDGDLREKCAKNAKETANRRFHIRDMLDATYSVYQGDK